MNFLRKSLTLLVSGSLILVMPRNGFAFAAQANQSAAQPAASAEKQSAEQLQQLMAPIALYPDALVSQILAGATYPTEIVEANRWMQQHPNLKGKDLGNEVDKQSWDPSVKALAQFPSVLANMDKNLSWTSALGEAYVNQPQDVMQAVQAMRARAQQSGNLKSNKQEKVETRGRTIVIEPADPEVVYVPTYDPWLVYGAGVAMWPGWYGYPGLYIAGPGIFFGLGFGIGFFGGFGWGWHHWGMDWGHRAVLFNHNAFISHSRTFGGGHGGIRDFGAARAYRGAAYGGGSHAAGFHGGPGSRGSARHSQPGPRSGAFGGFDHGGVAHSYSSRGRSSFGGGGSHGGGGRH